MNSLLERCFCVLYHIIVYYTNLDFIRSYSIEASAVPNMNKK